MTYMITVVIKQKRLPLSDKILSMTLTRWCLLLKQRKMQCISNNILSKFYFRIDLLYFLSAFMSGMVLGTIMAIYRCVWVCGYQNIQFDAFQCRMANLTAVILLGVGVTNLLIGVDAEHLWRTLEAARKDPFCYR